MTNLAMLWLPILLSTVFVFVASSVIHMSPLWHRNDYPKMPNEEKAMEALRPLAIPPGDYMVPRASGMEEMRSKEFAARMEKGPVLIVTVLPSGAWTMGRNLVLWFLYCLAVTLFAGYVAAHALGIGAAQREIIRFVGLTSFLGYAAALWQMSIWYRRAWGITVKATFDGLIYALITAATFTWLWPR
jgi:hypothetical protein